MGGREPEQGAGVPARTPGTGELDAIDAALEACNRQPHDLPAVMELLKYVPRLTTIARAMRRLRQELLAEPAPPPMRRRDLEAEGLVVALEHDAGGRSALRRQLRAVARDMPGVDQLVSIEATLSAFSRQPYDLSVVTRLSAQVPNLAAMIRALRRLGLQPLIPGRDPVAARGRPVGSRVVRPRPRDTRAESRRPGRAMAAGTAVLATLVAVIAALLIHPGQRQGTTSPVAAFALSMSGAHVRQGYASGQVVRLRWKGPVKSAIYRLQITRSRAPEPHPFARPAWRAVLTDRPSYQLRVVGAQLYYWRVQAFYGASWHTPSRPRVIAVARPDIRVAVPRVPRNGSVLRPGRVALCWSKVPGAGAYRLRLDGHRVGGMVRATCGKTEVRPGKHQWSVAAVVRAAETYTGPDSRAVRFLARAPHRRRARVHRHVAPVPRSPRAVAPALPATSPRLGPVYRPAPRRPVQVYQPVPAPRYLATAPVAAAPVIHRVPAAAPASRPVRRHSPAPVRRARQRQPLLPPPPPSVPAAPIAHASIPPPPPPPPSPTSSH